MENVTLRKARPEDLQIIISIDDESSKLYLEARLKLELATNHPFVVAESMRWGDAIDQELAYVAVDSLKKPIGFMILSFIDNAPYLDQVSVHPSNMRQGVGTQLLEKAISWSSNRPLWLTTYSHLAWNRPYYEKFGFIAISEKFCGPQLCNILDDQRSFLPAPEQRIAMVRYANC